jgi:hypothetical protein
VPPTIIDEGAYQGYNKPESEPEPLFAEKTELVTVAVGRKCASTKEHDEPDRDQDRNREE